MNLTVGGVSRESHFLNPQTQNTSTRRALKAIPPIAFFDVPKNALSRSVISLPITAKQIAPIR
ncbi:MAG: hypothetical protein M3X11_24850, partial [Acidobacteriota bacterium]|nr:hypothetical protein [Acidobacteriota bacterium]